MTKKIFLLILFTLFVPLTFGYINPAIAALPIGNRVKDPYAILRNSLPIDQKNLREIQHTLEDTSDLIRGNRWPAVNQAASRSQFIFNTYSDKILQSVPSQKQSQAKDLLSELQEKLTILNEEATNKNKTSFIDTRRKALQKIGDLEGLLLPQEFPHKIPAEFNNLSRL